MDTAPTSANNGEKTFYRAAASADVKEGVFSCVSLRGKKILLTREAGICRALDNRCTHAGGPLCTGKRVAGGFVECSWHGAQYEIATGNAVKLPARLGVRMYPVREADGIVEIEI